MAGSEWKLMQLPFSVKALSKAFKVSRMIEESVLKI